MAEYTITCWHCMGEYDASTAVWCSCNPNKPTKVCPFCLRCFCDSPEEYHTSFWASAPDSLVKDREMLVKARGPLGETLIKAKVITSDQLLMALKRQETTGEKLGEILVDLGFLTQETLTAFLSSQRSITRVSLKEMPPDPMLISAIGAKECLAHLVVPISKERLRTKELLTLAMADPSDGEALELVQNATGCQILSVQCDREEIERFLKPFLSSDDSRNGDSTPEEEPSSARLATELLRKALDRGASDLYLEPQAGKVAIHLRIDGALFQANPISKTYQDRITREIKAMVRLDAEVTDRPQEGRVVMRMGDIRFDVIAHSLPTPNGENLSLKIINRSTFFKTYDQLGISSKDALALRTALTAQKGLILLSAPLFHGSTTTLYAVMKDLSGDNQRKMMSVEAQSICPVAGISQISLGEHRDKEVTETTLNAISSIQPDVCILADLIELPSMALQASKLSRQMLVIITMEASSCVQAVKRLVGVGFPKDALSKNLLAAMNQRLVRRICESCVRPVEISQNTRRIMGLTVKESSNLKKVFQGEGCEKCSSIGYRGRLALFEFLSPSAGFRRVLSRGASERVLGREAKRGGMVSLRQLALEEIQAGRTTLDEFRKAEF